MLGSAVNVGSTHVFYTTQENNIYTHIMYYSFDLQLEVGY